ncbi:MAG TPA: FHA domain-containing protein [Candidatus Baltobacteraceae bacterium]
MSAGPNIHLLSLGVVGAAGLYALLAQPRRWARRSRDDVAVLQAVELRVEEQGKTRTLRVPLPVTIGRAADAQLVISDAQVSRMHARIELHDGTLRIRDLDSRNGTLVNARPIDVPAALRTGDEIDVGPARIVLGEVTPWR